MEAQVQQMSIMQDQMRAMISELQSRNAGTDSGDHFWAKRGPILDFMGSIPREISRTFHSNEIESK